MARDAEQLRDRLEQLTRRPTWHQASTLGVELVDHPDTDNVGAFHLANGDVVYPTDTGWEIVDQARDGLTIRSGDMERIHNPGIDPTARIHPTARIDPTARVEAGAVVGAHAHVGTHAHIGRDSHTGRATHIGDGAFIGTGATIRGGTQIGQGAVIGAGSELGSCTRIGAGAELAQHSVLDAHSAVTGRDKIGAQHGPIHRPGSGRTSHVANMIERLATLNRE